MLPRKTKETKPQPTPPPQVRSPPPTAAARNELLRRRETPRLIQSTVTQPPPPVPSKRPHRKSTGSCRHKAPFSPRHCASAGLSGQRRRSRRRRARRSNFSTAPREATKTRLPPRGLRRRRRGTTTRRRQATRTKMSTGKKTPPASMKASSATPNPRDHNEGGAPFGGRQAKKTAPSQASIAAAAALNPKQVSPLPPASDGRFQTN